MRRGFAAFFAVMRDRKTVRFVANLLHQAQRGRLCRQRDSFNAIASEQQFLLFRKADRDQAIETRFSAPRNESMRR